MCHDHRFLTVGAQLFMSVVLVNSRWSKMAMPKSDHSGIQPRERRATLAVASRTWIVGVPYAGRSAPSHGRHLPDRRVLRRNGIPRFTFARWFEGLNGLVPRMDPVIVPAKGLPRHIRLWQ